MDNGNFIAQSLCLSHDVRGEDDALSGRLQLGYGIEHSPGNQHVQP